MSQKAEKFKSRFLQLSLGQVLSTMGVYKQLLDLLSEDEIDRLVEENVYFSQTCSPSAIMQLSNVPACDSMKLITIEMTYLRMFLPEEVTGILLHELGHAFNPDKQKMEGEFAADNFAKEKGYSKLIESGLKNGLKKNLIGFDKETIDQRIKNLNS
jgi:hypothetical protein